MLATKTRIAVAVTNKGQVSNREVRARTFSETSPRSEIDAILDARLGVGGDGEA
jgi:hypothetical protein